MITFSNVTRRYRAEDPRPALDGISLTLAESGFTAITGPSGSGKSTLLHLSAGLDRPDSGDIEVGGKTISGMPEKELAHWRGRAVGLVFQAHLLLPTLTAAENIIAPMEFTSAVSKPARRDRALELLATFGLEGLANRLPSQLSGGQQQRVAIARALACDAPLILADEPTGNLDSEASDVVIKALRQIADAGRTIVMVTHDPVAAEAADTRIALVDGRLAERAAA